MIKIPISNQQRKNLEEFHVRVVKKIIEKRLNDLEEATDVSKKKSETKILKEIRGFTKTDRVLLNNFCKFLKKKTKYIELSCTIQPEHFTRINNRVEKYRNDRQSIIHQVENKLGKKFFFKYLNYIFNFRSYSDNYGYRFVEYLNIRVCPYCNIDYVFTAFSQKTSKGTRPDIDHIYPKSIYPWFALYLYNLIPSCKVCNQKKGNVYYQDFLNLYQEGLVDKFKFYAIVENPQSIFSNGIDGNFEVKLVHDNDINVIAHDKILLLEKRYNNFTDIINEIKVKQVIYSNDYIENLVNQYDFISNFDDAYRLVWGNYYNVEDFHKRPLAKFTSDIINQFSNES